MAADCEQTRARMLELVYGELPADARADVDAHVAGCAACRAELTALESTRALARRALAADEPPPRAHAAILRAAAAAVPAARRPAPTVSKPSAWAWLRGKWTLPTFATVGAVAVFLLASRIFLEPEKTYERGREGLVPAEPANPPGAQPVPQEKAEPAAATPAGPAAGAPEPTFAAKPAAAPPRRRRAAPVARADQPEIEAERAAPEFAPPPPAAPAAAPAPRAAPARAFAPAPPAGARGELLERRPDEDRAAAFGSTEDRQAAAGNAKTRAAKQPTKKTEAPAAEDLAAAPATASAAPRSGGGRESPVARADRLFTQARWAEAAIAYRELLRDDPRNPDVPRWRQRLAACEAAAHPP